MRRIDGLVLIMPCYKDRSGLHGCCAHQLKAGLEGKLAIAVVRKLPAGYAAAGKLSNRCLVAVLQELEGWRCGESWLVRWMSAELPFDASIDSLVLWVGV